MAEVEFRFSYRMPARMKELTNWRWNSRKAIKSGATLSSVAALMVAQFTPVSGAEKIARPTVSGRVSTEFVTTS
ncbi:MAG: hypothetical protein RI516_07825, partial [Spiribacter sp.]|nr:hypothetical protein [Spiribacter sp.]